MLPNGDFEADPHEAFRITNWIKIKEKGANGGGIIGNGSDAGATGWPGYPFDNKNNYFKTQAFGNVGFALVNQYAIEVNSTRQVSRGAPLEGRDGGEGRGEGPMAAGRGGKRIGESLWV